MAVDSKNKSRTIKHVRSGLSIYQTGRSPYWYIRFRVPLAGKYIVRSSKEKSRVEAIAAALEFADNYRGKANSHLATKKSTSFEHYANMLIKLQKKDSKNPNGDRKLLNRSKDGLKYYFGHYDVAKINTGMVRDYLFQLDQNRSKDLAGSTKAKHVIVLSKVLRLAVEDGVLNVMPVMPRQKTVDTPRHAFTDGDYKKFMKAATECVKRGDLVRGVRVTYHHVFMFKFIVQSFLRPTVGELFGLRHKEIQIQGSPPHLEMNVRGGKTGKRTSVTMPLGVVLYQSLWNQQDKSRPDKDSYVWMPEYPNRTTAINTSRRIFNHILAAGELLDNDRKLSPYSLRHYALQARLRGSNGKVNIFNLAKNAGTSVDQLERFYLSKMPPSKAMIKNLQSKGDD